MAAFPYLRPLVPAWPATGSLKRLLPPSPPASYCRDPGHVHLYAAPYEFVRLGGQHLTALRRSGRYHLIHAVVIIAVLLIGVCSTMYTAFSFIFHGHSTFPQIFLSFSKF